MRRIPSQFQLLGHTIEVRVLSEKFWDQHAKEAGFDDAVGGWIPAKHLIIVKRQPPTMLWHTFYHELTHAILDMMGHKLCHDESFVDLMGGLLAQAMQSLR